MLAERVALEQDRLRQMDDLLSRPETRALVGATVAKALQMLVAKQVQSFDDLTKTGQDWTRLAQRVKTGQRIFAECMSVVAGASARAMPVLARASLEAQALASELARETQVAATHDVIPADTECAGLASSVVRRRFPDYGIWDVPVVAHEFGHLVVRDLLDVNPLTGDQSRPLADYLSGRKVQAAELAADVYAVFALGPAYVLTLVLHRMDPFARAVATDSATHPGDACRVHAVIHALEKLDASDSLVERRGQYDFVVELLRTWWAAAQESANANARLAEADAAEIRKQTNDIWNKLIGSKLVSTRYDSFVEARALAGAIGKPEPVLPSASSVRDALNAVWLVRLRAWRDDEQLAPAVALWGCEELRRLQRANMGDPDG